MPRNHTVTLPTEKVFDCACEADSRSPPRIKVDLMLLSEPHQGFMESIDINLRRLAVTPAVATLNEHTDTASGFIQPSAGAAATLGPYIEPLEQTLQGVVKVMDVISEVCLQYLF